MRSSLLAHELPRALAPVVHAYWLLLAPHFPTLPAPPHPPPQLEGLLKADGKDVDQNSDERFMYCPSTLEEWAVDQAKEAARLCFINVLVHLKAACGGDLDRVNRVIRLGGFVASPSEFTQQALVMNGASDLAVAVFGEAGRHARTTIGVPSLPADAAVEVEGMFEIL